LLRKILEGIPRIDRVTARAKATDRFLEKACRRDESDKPHYLDPLVEVQDQIGARVVTFYISDVSVVRELVTKEFVAIEDQKAGSLIPEQFGYEAWHLVCGVPSDIVKRTASPVDFFELQIATLFQHAWAEAHHDLGYKPAGEPLNDETRRRVAWAAAQAWGADQIFDDLWRTRTGKAQP
jgi:ppGpp synthetase/RelA/SpoT-type nucleotidyltranferase